MSSLLIYTKLVFMHCKSQNILAYYLVVKAFQGCVVVHFICLHHVHPLVYICKIFFGINFLLDFYSGQWDMKNRKFYQHATIESWGLLVYGEGFPGNKIDPFKICLKKAA